LNGESHNAKRTGLLLFIAYMGFISLGLPDTLIGVAWPSVRDRFNLSQSAVALIFFGSGFAYFFSSFFSGRLLRAFRVGTLLAVSSALVAVSGFGYASANIWILFAACSLLHGLGSGAIDSGLNHYVAHHFSARHMNWLHACYSIGAMLGPLIMTSFIAWNESWRSGYLVVASTLLTLSILFALTRRLWTDSTPQTQNSAEPSATTAETLRHPLVWLHILLFFIYTGLEVTIGQWSFTILKEGRGLTEERAGLWVTAYWASIAAGRIAFGFVVERFGIDRLVRFSLLTSALGTILFFLNLSETVSGISLVLCGLGLAAIFPCLMTRTPERLGKRLAAHAIGMQVSAAMIGAAALPSIAGLLAQNVSLQSVPTWSVALSVFLFALHEFVLRSGPLLPKTSAS
jgi:fucose permease